MGPHTSSLFPAFLQGGGRQAGRQAGQAGGQEDRRAGRQDRREDRRMEVDMEKWIIQLRISMTWTLDLPHIRLLSVSYPSLIRLLSASCVWYLPLVRRIPSSDSCLVGSTLTTTDFA